MAARRLLLPAVLALLALRTASVRAEDPPPPAPPGPASKGPSEAERKECKVLVAGLHEDAARIRGLAWKDPCPADLISRLQMRDEFVADLDQDYPPAKRARDEAILRRVGMLAPGEDWLKMNLDFFEVGVGGYYVPQRRHLRIVEGFPGEAMRPLILHELIHALEDQHLGLEARTKKFEDDSDRLFAEKCIEEGSAEYAREVYEAEHPDIAEKFHAMEAKQGEDPKAQEVQLNTPAFVFMPVLMQYSHGLAFVRRAVKGGTYPERMAELYRDPPVSQEQILHPRRWFGPARDYPQAVVWAGDLAATAGEGWSRFYELPSGELDLSLYIDFFTSGTNGRVDPASGSVPPSDYAKRAALGWDAGWISFLAKKDLPLARVEAWAFDTAADAWEAAQAFAEVARKAAGAAWKGGDWVRVPADGALPTKATLDYVNQHGTSRLALDGTHVLLVDGVPADVRDRLWPVVLKTSFVRDARDTWDPASVDPVFAATTFKDEKRGVGLSVPGKAWTAAAADDPPLAFAAVKHAERQVTVTLMTLDQSVPVSTLLPMLLTQLRMLFPELKPEKAGTVKIGEADGTRIVLGAGGESGYGEFVVASTEDRVWLAQLDGPDAAAVDAVRAEIAKILASVVVRED